MHTCFRRVHSFVRLGDLRFKPYRLFYLQRGDGESQPGLTRVEDKENGFDGAGVETTSRFKYRNFNSRTC